MHGIDLIFLILAAVFLVMRFINVLGQEDSETFERIKKIQKIMNDDVQNEVIVQDVDPANKHSVFLKTRTASEVLTLKEIWAEWPSFDPEKFLKGAQKAFVLIVESFAEGDMKELAVLVSSLLLKQFRSIVDERREKGESHAARVENVKELRIKEAKNVNGFVTISLDIHSFQSFTITDKNGKIIDATKEDLEELWDRWSFSRDMNDKNPTWTLTNIEATPETERF